MELSWTIFSNDKQHENTMKHQPSNPEPIAQNPWQPKDHNAHNNLENPSPKATQQPTMDSTA